METTYFDPHIPDVNQETTPTELPIGGEPNVDIFLDLVFPKGPPTFFLNGKKLQLLAPIDRDEDNLSHIVFQVTIIVSYDAIAITTKLFIYISSLVYSSLHHASFITCALLANIRLYCVLHSLFVYIFCLHYVNTPHTKNKVTF